jgi:S-adenosylmethionine:tRNA ribosyltransferase-isomerase
MVLDRATGGVEHRRFRELAALLAPGDLIVVNRSRVLPARLLGCRRGGGSAEILLLREVAGAHGAGAWEAFVRPGRRLRPGDEVAVGEGLRVRVETRVLADDGRRRVRLEAEEGDVGRALAVLGLPPLPPYIRRPADVRDRERYQTVFARDDGSVAAPTAGLHFSPAVLASLAERGVELSEVVLHVGPGTFQPVKVENVEEHRVAAEPYLVPEETAGAIRRARARGGRVLAVGTTVARALETVGRDDGTVDGGAGETALVIVPGFRFRVVDALLTNFHLPRSSLLLLVSAFAGRERVLAAYAQAVDAGYRFYSYGDAMLVR